MTWRLIVVVLIDLFIATQFTLPITAISDARTSEIQKKMDQQAEGFPIPRKQIAEVIHQGGRAFYPIWFNQNMLKKEIAHNGYNNLKFKAYRDFKNQDGHMEKLAHPLLYLEEKEKNKGTVNIKSFSPNQLTADITLEQKSTVTLLQYAYPGWSLIVDGEERAFQIKDDIFLSFNLDEGQHQITLHFHPTAYLLFLFISFTGSVVVLCLISYQSSTSGRS